ncbi:hypothetical protein GCM10022270_10770 [Terriglobus aquaticus]
MEMVPVMGSACAAMADAKARITAAIHGDVRVIGPPESDRLFAACLVHKQAGPVNSQFWVDR